MTKKTRPVLKGVVIAGTHSGCGKTTVTLGILSALKKKGLRAQPFKAGPDFIDAGLHASVTGLSSRNLDVWMCGEEGVRQCFYKYASDADISVVEGVMGMYDGSYSTAALAGLLQVPVVLVVDAYGMAESAGAVVEGFAEHRKTNTFAGVIFNRVSSKRHFDMLKRAIRKVPVLGYLPYDRDFEIKERHLGLMTAQESHLSQRDIDRLGKTVLEHIDVKDIIDRSVVGAGPRGRHSAGVRPSAGRLKNLKDVDSSPSAQNDRIKTGPSPNIRIALAYDRAFCFYYEDNLDALRDAGAEIIKFSPLQDKRLPEADVLYLGGGYPEVHAQALSENRPMMESVRRWVGANRPIYAECGGMMYLSKGIHGFDSRFYRMAGVMPFETVMDRSNLYLGYREIVLKEDCIIGKKGDRLRGQEFHYSHLRTVSPDRSLKTCYKLGRRNREEGYRVQRVLASYIHIHFCSNPDIAGHFINFVRQGDIECSGDV